MRFLVSALFAIALIVAAFHFAKPLPGTNFDESFLPKASSVKYIAAGNDASAAGLFWIKGLTELGESFLTGREYAYLGHIANLCTELDSLFYTPYYFVSGVTAIDAPDTSDFVVLRRATRVYPEKWRVAVSLALRLSKGPYPDKKAAADVMRPYFDSPDTTMPDHIRLMYRSFELDQEQTETALEMVLNDVMQPRFKRFRESLYNKTYRILGYRGIKATAQDSLTFNKVKGIIDLVFEQKIHPAVAYNQLLSMKREDVPADSAATAAVDAGAVSANAPADSAATAGGKVPASETVLASETAPANGNASAEGNAAANDSARAAVR